MSNPRDHWDSLDADDSLKFLNKPLDRLDYRAGHAPMSDDRWRAPDPDPNDPRLTGLDDPRR